jgi:hypothetical protein
MALVEKQFRQRSTDAADLACGAGDEDGPGLRGECRGHDGLSVFLEGFFRQLCAPTVQRSNVISLPMGDGKTSPTKTSRPSPGARG